MNQYLINIDQITQEGFHIILRMDKLNMFPRCHVDPKHSRQCMHYIINQAKIPYCVKTTPPLNENQHDPYRLFWKHPSFTWIHDNLSLFKTFKNIIINSLKMLHTTSRLLTKDLKQVCFKNNKLNRNEVTNKLIPFFNLPPPRWVPHMLSVELLSLNYYYYYYH